MKRSSYTIAALLGFLSGVSLYLLWQPSWSVIGLGLGGGMSFLGVWALLRRTTFGSDTWISPIYPWLAWVGLILFFSFLGLGRATFSVHHPTPVDADFYHGQEVLLEGLVRQVDARQDQVKYTIEVESLQLRGQKESAGQNAPPSTSPETTSEMDKIKPAEGLVLVSLDRYPRYAYGDRLRFKGELREPGKIDDFDYGHYLSRYGIYSVMYRPWAERLESGLGNPFWAVMVKAQDGFLNRIARLFPEPYASFEAGLLVGARKGIPQALMEKFNITGLTHIIAISGYNITLIIVFVMGLLKNLPRRIQFIVAVSAIVLFTFFVGASPAVVRASIMGVLGLFALQTGRQSNIHITVLFAAFLMVLWNPKTLWWDVGFQLSFAAVLGLIYVAPWFNRWAQKLPEALGIREAIQMTLSAQVTALPIIVYNFGRLSLIAPLANLLVAFALPAAMLFGFMAVLLSFVSLSLALLPAYMAWGVLAYIIQIIEWTAAIPYASVDWPEMALWSMLAYYVILIAFLIWKGPPKKIEMAVVEREV